VTVAGTIKVDVDHAGDAGTMYQTVTSGMIEEFETLVPATIKDLIRTSVSPIREDE